MIVARIVLRLSNGRRDDALLDEREQVQVRVPRDVTELQARIGVEEVERTLTGESRRKERRLKSNGVPGGMTSSTSHETLSAFRTHVA